MTSLTKKVMKKFGWNSPEKNSKHPYEYLLQLPRYQPLTVELEGLPFNVADPLSFYWSYREIFEDEIYRFETSNHSPVIVDCGSNYGTSIVYFKTRYPNARINGVEADPRVFELLSENVHARGYDQVTLHNNVVSNSDQPVSFYHEGADGGRTRPHENESPSFTVDPIQLDGLLSEDVDFLKMDIEGSETEVICNAERLRYVRKMFIEYHSFVESEQTLNLILEKLTSTGFRYFIQTQFCSPQPFVETTTQLGMDLQLNIFAIQV